MTFLDPLILAQLGNLEIRSRRLLDGFTSGRHINRSRGTSKEFSEHRPYNPGDDLRSLDWRVFGRTDRLVLKQYDDETSMAALLLVDDSASMGFHSDATVSKLEYAKTMAAALGTLLVAQHDAVGLVTAERHLPVRSHESALDPLYHLLESTTPRGLWDPTGLFDRVGAIMKKRGLIMVLSDLMGDFNHLTSILRAFHSHRHDVMVFQILDPAEIDLPYDGTIIFEDAETRETIRTEPESIREAYREFVQGKIHDATQFFQSAGMDYVLLTTDTPFDKGLGAYLSWRAAHL